MTNAPTLTGQDIALAANASRALLDSLLAQTATTFHQWVALNFTGTNGGGVQRDAVVQRMVFALKIDQATASTTIDELVDAGLATTSDNHFALTAAGIARFEHIRDGSTAITERLYRDLPPDDLVAARRILTIVTERANAELAATGVRAPVSRRRSASRPVLRGAEHEFLDRRSRRLRLRVTRSGSDGRRRGRTPRTRGPAGLVRI